jgi:hypothetical protein
MRFRFFWSRRQGFGLDSESNLGQTRDPNFEKINRCKINDIFTSPRKYDRSNDNVCQSFSICFWVIRPRKIGFLRCFFANFCLEDSFFWPILVWDSWRAWIDSLTFCASLLALQKKSSKESNHPESSLHYFSLTNCSEDRSSFCSFDHRASLFFFSLSLSMILHLFTALVFLIWLSNLDRCFEKATPFLRFSLSAAVSVRFCFSLLLLF